MFYLFYVLGGATKIYIYIYTLWFFNAAMGKIIFLASGRVGTDLAGWNSWRCTSPTGRWMADQFVVYIYIYNWLVVLTILKNISQWEGLSHMLWKIKNV